MKCSRYNAPSTVELLLSELDALRITLDRAVEVGDREKSARLINSIVKTAGMIDRL